jgi:hypothetical protein
MERDRNNHVRPVTGQRLRTDDRQQSAEFFREWLAGIVLESDHGLAQPAVIRPEPDGRVEVES